MITDPYSLEINVSEKQQQTGILLTFNFSSEDKVKRDRPHPSKIEEFKFVKA